jgi:hypothetical protein
MKQLWIGVIIAGGLVACRNGPNNARDTTGMGPGVSAGGSVPTPSDTTGKSGANATTPPGASVPGSAAGNTTTTAQPDTAKRHKKSP